MGVDGAIELLLRRRMGQVVGPHGAGKSTLVAAMARGLRRRGIAVVEQRPGAAIAPAERGGVLVVDGYEQLTPYGRWRLGAAAWAGGFGLLATTHRPCRLGAVLADLSPSAETAHAAFALLTTERPTPVTAADVNRCYHLHKPNLREMWFELYDLHERLTAA